MSLRIRDDSIDSGGSGGGGMFSFLHFWDF